MRAAQQANEALQLQMTQLRAQLADVNRQNSELRAQNRDLSWQLQQMRQQRPPLRASTSNDSEDTQALRTQVPTYTCGVVVAQWSEHWRLKPGALGSIPGGCPDVFSSSKLSDVHVDGVMSSVVL